ncbi:MAG: hypothetical protein DSM106950_02895 [Stigonema ocellatum SAG 48.90 = DSM 106950]|nr:hypothetical protein [Stigonema ocellatum SAG 48.90 = DSM 106950]
MNKKTLVTLFSATTLLSTLSTITPANAANFLVTVEAPKVQESSLLKSGSGATNVYEDTFNSDKVGVFNQVYFNGDSNIGTYQNVFINSADQYGSAGGTGNYFDVDKNRSKQYSTSTLTLKTPQRYFGLWWSAGDASNTLDFYSGNTLVDSFTTSDVIQFIAKQPNSKDYYGNPTQNYQGQDSSEPFAFLNFYADPNNTNVTFDKIVFSNNSGTGFESDNHTIAQSYKTTSGTSISKSVPESSSSLGIFLTGIVGLSSIFTRRIRQRLFGGVA